MKVFGGPRDGENISITKKPGGPEIQDEGIVLEYNVATPGQVKVRLHWDANPKPSSPGVTQVYRCRDGAWHYIPPLPTGSKAAGD